MAVSRNPKRRPKGPKLYRVGLDFRIHTRPGLEMENFAALGAGRVLLSIGSYFTTSGSYPIG
jgi:hypothetical protein